MQEGRFPVGHHRQRLIAWPNMVQTSFEEKPVYAEAREESSDRHALHVREAGQQHLDPQGSQKEGHELLAVHRPDDRAGPLASAGKGSQVGLSVRRSTFEDCLSHWFRQSKITLDTETTGLRAYHGDRLFSLILSTGDVTHYFNFQPYPGLEPDLVLTPSHLEKLRPLFARDDVEWVGHNLKFDLHMLAQDGLEVGGTLHCTQAIARVEYNEHLDYGLGACAERIGLRKDDAVGKYIEEHKLVEKRQGANQAYTHPFFDRVPYPIISAYGLRDGEITARLARHQEAACQKISDETPKGLPALSNIVRNEKRLTRTVFRMERVGLRIDREYCLRATRYETDRAEKATQSFKSLTGRDFSASAKLFATVFESDRENWGVTEKGNPSFDSDSLASFKHPAAKAILEYRDAKSKADFYRGFLYHADANGDVHPNFNPPGAATGRFTSADPNFQNLTNADEENPQEFEVRRAIVPRPGFLLYSLDWSAVEYRLMFEYACRGVGFETELVKRIKTGVDPHQATADLVTALGTPLTRKRAKNGNFALLYGSGDRTLAATIGGSVSEARALRASIFTVAPEIKTFVDSVMRTAEVRGFIRDWAGRRFYCPNPRFSYKFPNRLIQGGAADINKFALTGIDDFLLGRKSRMIANIHDEIVLEAHESELACIPRVKEIMETVFPAQYLDFPVSVEWSAQSLADLHT